MEKYQDRSFSENATVLPVTWRKANDYSGFLVNAVIDVIPTTADYAFSVRVTSSGLLYKKDCVKKVQISHIMRNHGHSNFFWQRVAMFSEHISLASVKKPTVPWIRACKSCPCQYQQTRQDQNKGERVTAFLGFSKRFGAKRCNEWFYL